MMKTVLKLTGQIWQSIRQYHAAPTERISYAYARSVIRDGRRLLICSGQLVLPGPDCYVGSSRTHLRLYKDVVCGVVYECFREGEYDVLINIHHHPFSRSGTSFSPVDDRDDLAFDKALREISKETGREYVSVSVVLDEKSFDARVTNPNNPSSPFQPVHEVQCLGDELSVLFPNSSAKPSTEVSPLVSRHDFVGAEILAWMQGATIGICGAGGLGSILAEGVARLGFGKLVLVDDDRVEDTNLNRLQGIEAAQVGMRKVDAVREHLSAISPALEIITLNNSLRDEAAINALTGCDILLGAVDNSVPRAMLNHLAVQYCIPYFDAGVDIQLDPVNFRYRLFAVLPGTTSCMECSPFKVLKTEEVIKALLNPALEIEFRHRGYIQDEGKINAPSVYPLNMQASGALLTELVNYLGGFRPVTTTLFSDYQGNKYERADRENYPDNRPAEDCPLCSFYAARGDHVTLPFSQCLDADNFLEYFKAVT
jgi:molybdopterin/thiamine biosynthesis adenylyltransferase